MKHTFSPQKRLSLAFFIFLVLFIPRLLRADATSNQFVWAEVENNTGLITIWSPPGPGIGYRLSYEDKSYLTVRIGPSKIYTNNHWVVGQPNVNSLLTGGILTRHVCATHETGDTIRCTWTNKNGCDIIQDVWPVAFDRYGQIAISVRFKNTSIATINAQSQYLLDVEPGNDNAQILTKWSYSPNWQVYPNGSKDVPEYFLAFQNNLPFPAYGPGVLVSGYWDYPSTPLYLIKPSRVTIGDWQSNLSGTAWGTQTPMPLIAYGDAAVLLEFPSVTVFPDKTVEAMRTSYGTDDFEFCSSQFSALTKRPRKLKYANNTYAPNPFRVETFICNTNSTKSSSNTKLRLTAGPDLTITSPSPVTTDGSGFSTQVQVGGTAGTMAPHAVTYATWQVSAAPYTSTATDLSTWVQVAASGSLGNPLISDCDLAVVVPRMSSDDKFKPLVDDWSGYDADQQFQAHDNGTLDQGLHWPIAYSGTNLSNFTIIIDSFADCSKQAHAVHIHQIDTCIAGCINFHITDCAGNATDTSMCFKARKCAEKPHITMLSYINDTILVVKGNGFGNSGKLTVNGFELTPVSWTDSNIIAGQPLSGLGMGGRVEVTTLAGISNPRWITVWDMTGECFLNDHSSATKTTLHVSWRADITDAMLIDPDKENSVVYSPNIACDARVEVNGPKSSDSSFHPSAIFLVYDIRAHIFEIHVMYGLPSWACTWQPYSLDDTLAPSGYRNVGTVRFLPPYSDIARRPHLISPVKEWRLNQDTITFRWTKVFDTSQMQMSSDQTFKDPSMLIIDTAFRNYSLPLNQILRKDTEYYWRVRDKLNGYWGSWSEVTSFTVAPFANVRKLPPASIQVRYTTSHDAINFHITTPGEEASQFEIYDVLGVRVAEYALGRGQEHTVDIAKSRLSSGAYFYRVVQGGESRMGKVLVR